MESILCEVKANHAKKNSCSLHQFDAPPKMKLGQYYFCKNCGWKTRIVEIGHYARGYEAAGGNPDDIMMGIIKSKKGGE